MILILMVEGARAVISFCIRSAIPGYMVVKMASVSSADLLFLPAWLIRRRAPAFKRSPAPTTAAAAGTPDPEAKMTLVPRPLDAPVAVTMSAPKRALAEPTERTATTAEKTVAGFILLV